MSRIKEMFTYHQFHKRAIFHFCHYFIATVLTLLITQYLIYHITDEVTKSSNLHMVFVLSGIYALIIFISMAEIIYRTNYRHYLLRDWAAALREDIYQKIIHAKTPYMDQKTDTESIELMLKDTMKAANVFTHRGIMVFKGISLSLVLIIICMTIQYQITLIVLGLYLLGYGYVILSKKKSFAYNKEVRKINIEITKWINQSIDGSEYIKAASIEKTRLQGMRERLEQYQEKSMDLNLIIRRYICIFNILTFSSMIVVVLMGGMSLLEGTIQYASMMLLTKNITNIKNYFQLTINNESFINEGYISYLKILEFLDLENETDTGKLELKQIESIVFEDVCFSYGEEPFIQNLNVTIQGKEKCAVIGKTGSGKTTLVNLLCRFYEIDRGKILINGMEHTQYTLESLRKSIGYVMQDVVIFEGDIYHNINYVGREVSPKMMEDICMRLNLDEKIRSLPDGYRTVLTSQTEVFSQGEKQLINFARVMLEEANVIVLDEVTSSLSYENERLMKHAIQEISKDKMVIIIAHRLSTIRTCDKIIIMGQGRIIEQGNPKELEKQESEYRRLLSNQRKIPVEA